ncbi:MAG: flippase-like domain-containing protein [Bifidobacteriaceae bacterium]|nr:flippase-like domain-containing protein [Bifidobacteriaceae bacterium]
MAGAVRGNAAERSAAQTFQGVEVVDAPAGRVRQSGDLVGIVLAAVGLTAMAGLAIFAQGTAAAVAEDIRSLAHPVTVILQATVELLMNSATLLLPAIVLVTALVRRQLLLALQGVAGGLGGLALSLAAGWAISLANYEPLIQGLSGVVGGRPVVAIAPLASLMAGMLTAMGPRSRRPIMSASWNLFWIALTAWVLTGGATLPAAFANVLIGRLAGLAIRYAIGVTTDRATGSALVAGIRGAGLRPVRIVRVRDVSDPESPTERLDVRSLRASLGQPPAPDAAGSPTSAASVPLPVAPVAPVAPGTPVPRAGTPTPAPSGPLTPPGPVSDSISRALERQGGNRIYAVYDEDGRRYDAIVLDGDRQVLGFLQATWRALRLRGVDRRAVRSLRQAAERAALLGYAAASAGVRTPKLLGVGEAADSMMLLQAHPAGLRAIADMRPGEISDAALIDVWRQLDRAHRAGLAHRNITSSAVLFGPDSGETQQVWLMGWENGDVASSELARSLDLAQMVAVLALKVGAERAVAAAAAVFPAATLRALAGLLQPVVFPPPTREDARAQTDVIAATRLALAELTPSEATTTPFQLVRFGWRTVLVAAMTLVAIWAVVTRFNFNQMVDAVSHADPWWMALSFGLSLATYVGAAMTLVGLLPVRLSFRKTVLAQVAASFAAISMPGGVGPIAISMRFLNRQGIKTSLAAATVALGQVALLFTTVVLLVISSLATGETAALSNLPVAGIAAVAGVLALAASLLLIPKLRAWVWGKLGATFAQVWPRLVWVMGRPKRMAFAMAGTVVQFGGYVAAFWTALISFGLNDLPLGAVALVFLIGNTAGSAAPTPGGLGGVEIALTAGLRAIGVATATAASAAVLFRAITYWARVPLGWIAFRHLAKHQDL